MSNAKHTPEELLALLDSTLEAQCPEDKEIILEAMEWIEKHKAAPEMLELLREVTEQVFISDFQIVKEKARALLAKLESEG